jgi:RNA methyltransferase, TrmH family
MSKFSDRSGNPPFRALRNERAPRPITREDMVADRGPPRTPRDAQSAPSASPWGTPKAQRPEREMRDYQGRDRTRDYEAQTRAPRNPRAERPIRPYGRQDEPPREAMEDAPEASTTQQHSKELRVYGKHAVLGVAKYRTDAIRKVYYHRSAQNHLGELLRWCAANKVGYREVELDDLSRLAATEHHEGVVVDIVRASQQSLETLLASLAGKAFVRLLLLDGVANPHNLGAILRNAAHFDADAVLLTPGTHTDLSGAAYRVAEGGAEAQPLLHLKSVESFAQIKAAGFSFVAAHTRLAKSLWQQKLPPRCVIVFGAEGAGVSDMLLSHCEMRAAIPGSGKVESLNVAQSVAVFLAEAQRQSSR